MGITLRGLTWDHPRGYSPLVKGAPEYERTRRGVKILWDRRTLREFGEAPLEQFVNRYDLIVVDHPFVGFAAAHDVLLELSGYLSEADKTRFARDSVGPSWDSYWYGGGLWALPIDAATQVAAYRPDLLRQLSAAPPSTFDEVLQLGRKARERNKFLIIAACPIDAISLFFTLTASAGHPIHEKPGPFASNAVAHVALDRLHELIALAHPRSIDWNPIQVYDYMVANSDAVYCPWAYGYSNYSRHHSSARLKFTDAPGTDARRPARTQLGGTGIGVSRATAHAEEAVAYAKWLASLEHQRGTYFREGGQPASLAAWTDPEINIASDGFFSGTLKTLQKAYVRPRFDGFVRFFEAAGIEVNRCLRKEISDTPLIESLNGRFADGLVRAAHRTPKQSLSAEC